MENSDRYTGMKKNPYENSPKNAIKDKVAGKKRKKKIGNGNVAKKKGLSEYQLRTHEEFMKVRPEETREQWLMRTRFRRIRTEEEIATTKNGLKKIERYRINREKSKKKRQPLFLALDKDFNFLKYYVFIINWASIKYNVPQTDLEIGFHFYESIHFTKEEFINKCLLFSRTNINYFNRFKNEGYIKEVFTVMNKERVKKSTSTFRFVPKFISILTTIYEKISYQSHFDFRPAFQKIIPSEIEKLMIEMAQENLDILSGKKEPDKFIIPKN